MSRLTPAFLTLVLFGVVGFLVLAYVAKTLLARPEVKPVVATRNVPTAVADIEPGVLITDKHLGLAPIQTDRLKSDMLLATRVIVGRVTRTKIKAAEPIRANQLYQPDELPDLKVESGNRAVTVELADTTQLVDGMIKPGKYVDVLFTVTRADSNTDLQGGVTMRLFEGVKVVAINRSFTQTRLERGANHVTLELTEPQANIMTLAKERGEINLTFNPNGPGTGGLALNGRERITLNEILGVRPPSPVTPPMLTEVYRRTQRNITRFDKGTGAFVDSVQFNQQNQNQNQQRQVLPPSGPTTNDSTPDNNGAGNQPGATPSNSAVELAPTAIRNLVIPR